MASMDVTSAQAEGLKLDYLNLMVTQLRYQNPLEPMDQSDMTAQLAQISQLEQLEKVNSRFSDVLQAAERQYAASLIGRDVSFDAGDGETTLTGPVLGVALGAGGVLLQVGSQVVDLDDVYTIGTSAAGSLSAADRDAAAALLGREVTYVPPGGGSPMTGTATGILADDGQAYMVVGGQAVPLASCQAASDAAAGSLSAADRAQAAALVGKQIRYLPEGEGTLRTATVTEVRLDADGNLVLVAGGETVAASAVDSVL